MNSARHLEGRALGLGLLLLAGGASLLVTNLVGLWLASHAAILAPFVVGAWPMLLCGTGVALVLQGLASRIARRRAPEAPHAR